MTRQTPDFAFADATPPAQAAAEAVPSGRRAVAWWLLACCALVFVMVVVGGITRLTHSGLSIVEWQPIVGTLPPLDEAQWQEAFAKYKRTPEFAQRNFNMTLEGFKGIFWWEYIHRLLGRVIGIAFLIPFLYFLARRRVDAPLGWRLAGIFVLGGLQGAMGWYMVKSGLVDDPRVSQFRLTAHLSLAFLIFAAMLWTALNILRPVREGVTPQFRGWSTGVIALVALMVVTGGLVAGIRAGLAYNTFPLMNGHLVPPEILQLEPWWRNLGYNMATVQFNHRFFAWALAVVVPLLWLGIVRSRYTSAATRWAAHVLLAALAVQIALGISTLLLRVPVVLGTLHQGGAVVLLATALWLRHTLKN